MNIFHDLLTLFYTFLYNFLSRSFTFILCNYYGLMLVVDITYCLLAVYVSISSLVRLQFVSSSPLVCLQFVSSSPLVCLQFVSSSPLVCLQFVPSSPLVCLQFVSSSPLVRLLVGYHLCPCWLAFSSSVGWSSSLSMLVDNGQRLFWCCMCA